MAKDPAFLFYTGDFLVGVMTMSFEDRGKYITILSIMHQQGRMKEETIRLLVGSISDNLLSKFTKDENDFFYNKRLEEETQKRNSFTKSRRENGLRGGRPKEDKPSDYPSGSHKDNLMEDENENGNEDIEKEIKPEKKKRASKVFVAPTFNDFDSYCNTNGFGNISKRAYEYYSTADWKDRNGDQVKNWKQKLQGVWFRDENKDKAISDAQSKNGGMNY